MRFIVEKSTLSEALNLISPAILPKAARPIYKSVLIAADKKEQMIKLRSANLELSAWASFPAKVTSEGIVCVDSLLMTTVSMFSEDPITIEYKSKEFTLKQKRRKHKLPWIDHDHFLDHPEIKYPDKTYGVELIRTLTKCGAVVSDKIERMILQGIMINPHEKKVVASDGVRMVIQRDFDVEGNISIPTRSAISSVLTNLKKSVDSGSEIQFSVGNTNKKNNNEGQFNGFKSKLKLSDEVSIVWEIVLNSLQGEYPITIDRIEEFLNRENDLVLKVPIEDFKNIVTICSSYSKVAYAENRQRAVELFYENGKVRFIMDVKDLISCDETLECKVEKSNGSDTFQYWFDPRFVEDILPHLTQEFIHMGFTNHQTPFTIVDGNGFGYVQAQMGRREEKDES